MEQISRPRTLARTIAVAAITVLIAGCVTALGIGLEGILWQVKTATAEMVKAQAMMAQAQATVQAAVQQALGAIEAATRQANAMLGSAKFTAEAAVVSARLNKEGMVDSATANNIQNIRSSNAANELFYKPTQILSELSMKKAALQDEIRTNRDLSTQKPLTAEDVANRTEQMQVVERNLGVAGTGFRYSMQAITTNAFQAFADGLRALSSNGGQSGPPPINMNPFPNK